jgi:hypothetical protein
MAVCKIKVLLPGGQPVQHSFVALAYYDYGCGYSDEHVTDETGCAVFEKMQTGIADVLVNGMTLRQKIFLSDGAEIQVTLPQ